MKLGSISSSLLNEVNTWGSKDAQASWTRSGKELSARIVAAVVLPFAALFDAFVHVVQAGWNTSVAGTRYAANKITTVEFGENAWTNAKDHASFVKDYALVAPASPFLAAHSIDTLNAVYEAMNLELPTEEPEAATADVKDSSSKIVQFDDKKGTVAAPASDKKVASTK